MTATVKIDNPEKNDRDIIVEVSQIDEKFVIKPGKKFERYIFGAIKMVIYEEKAPHPEHR